MNRAEKSSWFERLKMRARLKCDIDRLDFSQFGWLDSSRYSFNSDHVPHVYLNNVAHDRSESSSWGGGMVDIFLSLRGRPLKGEGQLTNHE